MHLVGFIIKKHECKYVETNYLEFWLNIEVHKYSVMDIMLRTFFRTCVQVLEWTALNISSYNDVT